jgi:hypothetical protein
VTREIQHDRLPRFVTNTTILAVKGEPRHSRSYLYDVTTLEATRLFHNNTIPTDLLETVNHQLLVEAARANIASIMRLAWGESRLQDVKVGAPRAAGAEVSWTPSPEKGVKGYVVAYKPSSNPLARTLAVKEPRVALSALQLRKGDTLHVAVKAIDARGLESWDWARASVVVEK